VQALSLVLQAIVLVLTALVFARVILSWVDPRGGNVLSRFVIEMTEPLLAPIRRVLPQTGFIDFAPTILLVILFVLLRAL
jgi:YggT family protein